MPPITTVGTVFMSLASRQILSNYNLCSDSLTGEATWSEPEVVGDQISAVHALPLLPFLLVFPLPFPNYHPL